MKNVGSRRLRYPCCISLRRAPFWTKKNTLAHEDLQDRKKNAGEASASGAEAKEGPVFGGTDGDGAAVGEAVEDDGDHGEAETDDEDKEVLLERHQLAVAQGLGEHRERVARVDAMP